MTNPMVNMLKIAPKKENMKRVTGALSVVQPSIWVLCSGVKIPDASDRQFEAGISRMSLAQGFLPELILIRPKRQRFGNRIRRRVLPFVGSK